MSTSRPADMATARLWLPEGFPTVEMPAGWSSPDEGDPGSVPPQSRSGAPRRGPARRASRMRDTQLPAEVCPAVPANDRGGRTEGAPPPVVTTRPTLDAYQLRTPGHRPLRRLGTGLLTGTAASLAIVLSPAAATAAEPAPASSSSTPAPS